MNSSYVVEYDTISEKGFDYFYVFVIWIAGMTDRIAEDRVTAEVVAGRTMGNVRR